MPRQKEKLYHVEVITKARVDQEGEWEYFVKWAGYDSDANSWEPTENLLQCKQLLGRFWKHIGDDEEEYPVGYEVVAEENWINAEKDFFLKTFVRSSKRKSEKVAGRGKQKWNTSPSASYASNSASDDEQSSDEGSALNIPCAKKHGKKARIGDSDSDVDDRSHRIAPYKEATAPTSKNAPKISQVGWEASPSSSFFIPPPRVTAVRTHQEQRANPLVKTMTIPSNIEAGSFLSTKQRIAAGMALPTSGTKPSVPVARKPHHSLSFKKIKPLVTSTGSQANDTSTALVVTPTSPVALSQNATNSTDMVTSPQPMDVDGPVGHFDFSIDKAGPAKESSDGFAMPPSSSQVEMMTEDFLKTVFPEDVGAIPDQANQSRTELDGDAEIPSRWNWSGDLLISTSEDGIELLCAVTISDPSGTSNSSHINLLLSSLNALEISKLYPIMDLSFVLQACGKPQYFGRLDSSEPCEDAIHGLQHYLAAEGLFAAISLLLEGAEVAILVVFPGTQKNLTKKLDMPEQLVAGASLPVVLLPLLTSATNVAGWRPIETVIESLFCSQDAPINDLPQKAMLHLAMSLLGFPMRLLNFLKDTTAHRAYCIWPLPDQGSDTAMLQYILSSTNALLAKPEDDVRVAFISSRHLEAVHTMPSLVAKKNTPKVEFWAYGYSFIGSMDLGRYAVEEIYPTGGIVTFTSSALAEDLIGCAQLMMQVIEHPFWACYLTPEVLAVGHLLCSDENLESSKASDSESPLDCILELVTLGQILVVKMAGRGCFIQEALPSQICSQSGAGGHLEACFKALRSHSATLGMTTEHLVTFTNDELTKDLLNAQIQPVLMTNYRRFTVIKADSEGSIPLDKDGLEWSSLSSFSFKDNFFS